MCGIAGVLDRSGAPVPLDVLRRMSTVIAHRGPDDEGHFVDGCVGLVNRRLAIIDVSPAGHMPMASARGSLVITYNGELYNYRELKVELERCGHEFRSHTDTEVVLNAYEQWGAACVERFNGMFGLAIWDRLRRELFLARDRFGVKPLYYAEAGPLVLFGSEIKSLLAHDALRAELSREHLLEYFTFQNIFTDGTLFKGVRLLPAGHRLTVAADGGGVRPERYWDFDFREPADASADPREYDEELDRLFRQAVSRQLVADVPVGAHLSGGMDSGSITALAAQELPYLNTFTVGFDMTSAGGIELPTDEREKAEAMSYLFRTEHYEAVLKSGDMERCMPALMWHLEDPRVGQSYPNFYVSRLAGKFVKVVLAGTGGDELFAGYPWRYYRAVVNDDFDDYVEKYYRFWHRLIPNAVLPRFFRSEVWNDVGDVRTIDIFRARFPDTRAPSSPEEYVNHSLYLEAKTFLHGLFVVEDKLSMAHSLENRVPFMDNDLVDFAQQVPVALKLRNLHAVIRLNENEPGDKTQRYFQRTRDGKLILRRVMERYVPDTFTNQIKQGFTGPDANWFRGDSMDYIRREVLDPAAAIYEFLDPGGVRPLVEDHLEGRENRRLLLWSLMSFEHWCRTFLKGAHPVKVLVSGASGFLGRRLVPLLRARHEVIAVARRPIDGIETVIADLAAEPLNLPASFDAVIHLAQSRRYREWPGGAADVYAVNVHAAFQLLECARRAGASHFVLASTGAVYAPADRPLSEAALTGPAGFYPRSKLAAEVITEGYAGTLVTAVMRPFALYGEGQQGMLVANLAARVAAGEEVVVQGNPGLRLNPVHVDDAARAFVAALELERPGVFNVAGDKVVSITSLAELLGELAGVPPRIRHEPAVSASLVGDTTRMRDVLGAAPQVDLREGLAGVLSRRAGRAP